MCVSTFGFWWARGRDAMFEAQVVGGAVGRVGMCQNPEEPNCFQYLLFIFKAFEFLCTWENEDVITTSVGSIF